MTRVNSFTTRLVSNAMIFYERGNPWISPRDQAEMRRQQERLFYDGTEIEVQSPLSPKPRVQLPPQRVKHRPDAPDFSRKALAILRGK